MASFEGAELGSFTVPSGTANGETVVVSDPSVGPNSQIFLQQQGFGGTDLQLAVTAITTGSGFTVTTQSAAATTQATTVVYLRTG
jgi:hypothetical protein